MSTTQTKSVYRLERKVSQPHALSTEGELRLTGMEFAIAGPAQALGVEFTLLSAVSTFYEFHTSTSRSTP